MFSKAKVFLALAFMLCAALAHAADPPGRAGRLNYLTGQVSLASAAAPDDWAYATLNRPLTTGDRLWVDQNGRAELHVGSTAVRLASQTSLDILNLDDRTLQLRLAQGDVNVHVRALTGDETIEVDTPNGAILLEQPGSYRISAEPSGDNTSVIVHAGRAQVLTNTSGFPVQANQQLRISGPDGAPSEAVTVRGGDEFDRWSAERDRREGRVAATRYISPATTGYEDLDAYGTWRTVPQYGAVWTPAAVAADWAPYRYGHWVWIEPWGWTWVDDAPWGFAPFHYGRWIWFDGHWAWAPGPLIARPVYAPALVAFIGGSNWSVSIGAGPAVGWFPLGWHEPFFPWFHASPTFVRNVNITHVTNINVFNNVTQINFANQRVPQAVTVVSKNTFVSAKPVARETLKVSSTQIAQASLLKSTAPADPVRTSVAQRWGGPRPPAAVTAREVVAMHAPPAVAPRRLAATAPGAARPAEQPKDQRAAAAESPRVRVIGRQRGDANAPGRQASTPERTAPPQATPNNGPPQADANAQRRNVPRPPPADTNAQSRAVPRPPQRQIERDKPAAGLAPQARSAERREQRAPAPPPEVRSRPTPDRNARIERGPARPEPRVIPRNGGVEAQRAPLPQQRSEAPPHPPVPRAAPQPAPRVEAPRPPQREVAPRPPEAHGPRPGPGGLAAHGPPPAHPPAHPAPKKRGPDKKD